MQESNDYWATRAILLEAAQIKKGQEYYNNLDRQYKMAFKNIEKDITTWYARLAKNNGISYYDAKKILNENELTEFRWRVEEYIKNGQENAINQKWIKELENASAKVHITYLQALKLDLQQHIEILYGNQLDGVDKLMRNIYADNYYHSAFEIQKGLGVGWKVLELDETRISKVIATPWTVDERTFSDRIWTRKTELVQTVNTQMTQMVIRGDAPDKAIKAIAKQFGVKKSQAGNLVMTESAYFTAVSQKDCYNDLDMEWFVVVSALDLHTCHDCGNLDGKPVPMKDFEIGVTAAIFHSRCRCTNCPYVKDRDRTAMERAARHPVTGKTYNVPESMKYPEWKEKYITNDPKAILEQKKIKNLYNDEQQFKNYKKVLGNVSPKGFGEFRELKYGEKEKWETLKKTYRQANKNKL